MKSIKIREETYKQLFELAGLLQALKKRQVSVDETIRLLLENKKNVVNKTQKKTPPEKQGLIQNWVKKLFP